MRQVWNRGDLPGSGMMFEASDADVRGHLATLPLVKAGMMDIAAVVPLAPYPRTWTEALVLTATTQPAAIRATGYLLASTPSAPK